ncbi:hypothetical protein ABVT39_017252 [Epinephelus coioides]
MAKRWRHECARVCCRDLRVCVAWGFISLSPVTSDHYQGNELCHQRTGKMTHLPVCCNYKHPEVYNLFGLCEHSLLIHLSCISCGVMLVCYKVLGDAASGDAPPAVLDDSDPEAFPMAPRPSMLHCTTQCNIRLSAADKFIVCKSELMSLFSIYPACCGETQGHVEEQDSTFIKMKQCISAGTIFCHQRLYTIPTIVDIWQTQQAELISIGKALGTAVKERECEDLKLWKPAIINHLYWTAASTPDGNQDIMQVKWESMVNHVFDIHEHDTPTFPCCAHPPQGTRHGWDPVQYVAENA